MILVMMYVYVYQYICTTKLYIHIEECRRKLWTHSLLLGSIEATLVFIHSNIGQHMGDGAVIMECYFVHSFSVFYRIYEYYEIVNYLHIYIHNNTYV